MKKSKRVPNCICPTCKKRLYRPPYRMKASKKHYCDAKCYYKAPRTWAKGNLMIGLKGPKSFSWKGGRVLRNGYMSISSPNHPFRDAHGYVFEHRLVMEKILGRYLKPNDLVHHKGITYRKGDPRNLLDNRPENRELVTRSEHPKLHPRERNKLGQFI